MNDRYLYRAKRKNFRELQKEKWWVTGYLVNKKCGKYNTGGFEEFEAMIIVTSFSDGGIDWCYIFDDTICQCTGIKDKNGNLIFENDILSAHLDEKYPEDITYAKVIWWKNEFYTKEKGSNDMHEIDAFTEQNYEVVGNIFDNPELLEVGQ